MDYSEILIGGDGNANAAAKTLVVRPSDILCGREKLCVDSKGNQLFRAAIESSREKYARALTKFDKSQVIRQGVFKSLKSASCRFLRYNINKNAWEELPPEVAHDKIGHALRFANRRNRRAADTKHYVAGKLGADRPAALDTKSCGVPIQRRANQNFPHPTTLTCTPPMYNSSGHSTDVQEILYATSAAPSAAPCPGDAGFGKPWLLSSRVAPLARKSLWDKEQQQRTLKRTSKESSIGPVMQRSIFTGDEAVGNVDVLIEEWLAATTRDSEEFGC